MVDQIVEGVVAVQLNSPIGKTHKSPDEVRETWYKLFLQRRKLFPVSRAREILGNIRIAYCRYFSFLAMGPENRF
jgi:hypothetical protein